MARETRTRMTLTAAGELEVDQVVTETHDLPDRRARCGDALGPSAPTGGRPFLVRNWEQEAY